MAIDIEKLQGRELDNQIAVAVFGLKTRFERGEPCAWNVNEDGSTGEATHWSPNDYIVLKPDGEPENCIYLPSRLHNFQLVPAYSTNIQAAWLVVEKIFSNGGCVVLTCDPTWRASAECSIYLNASNVEPDAVVDADTTPLSICRAALKAARASSGQEESL